MFLFLLLEEKRYFVALEEEEFRVLFACNTNRDIPIKMLLSEYLTLHF